MNKNLTKAKETIKELLAGKMANFRHFL